MRNERCIVVFVKYPGPGAVKTRLAATLGDGFARSLYRLFVADTLDMLKDADCDTVIACDPCCAAELYSEWLGIDRAYLAQTGDGLGERMANAFIRTFAMGYAQVLLIGSDIPDLPGATIEQAFCSLSDHGAVLGPSEDGGYYLIGFTRNAFTDCVFREIAWSTPAVFKETLARMQAQRLSAHILPPWRDVDTKEDLSALYARNRHTQFAGSRSMQYLSQHQEVVHGKTGL